MTASLLDMQRFQTCEAMLAQGYQRTHIARVLGCSMNSLYVSVHKVRKNSAPPPAPPVKRRAAAKPEPEQQPEKQPEKPLAPVPEPRREDPEPEEKQVPALAPVPEMPVPRPPRTSLSSIRGGAEPYSPPVFEQHMPEPQVERPAEEPWKLPPMSRGAAEQIKSKEHLDEVWAAYSSPQVQYTANPGYLRRIAGTVSLVVSESEPQTIVWVGEHVVEPTVRMPGPVHTTVRKRSGSGKAGSVGPTTWGDMHKRLKAAGCTLDETGSHIKVRGPQGGVITLPKTASDYRSLPNCVRDARKHLGVDVRKVSA